MFEENHSDYDYGLKPKTGNGNMLPIYVFRNAPIFDFLYLCSQNGHANMKTSDHQVRDYSAMLEQFDEEAWNFYTSQLCSSPSFD